MAANSTKKSKESKERKFPLSQYKRADCAYWVKKVRGRRVYFEALKNDPDGEKSLKQWLESKDALLAGDVPGRRERANSGLTLADLVNHWLSHQKGQLEAGEITKRTFDEYHAVSLFLVKHVRKERAATSIVPEDFAIVRKALAEQYGVYGLDKRITQIRSLFRFAYEQGHLANEVRYGKSFEKPSAKRIRIHKASQGRMDFTREEILKMLEKPTVTQRAMVLLGINCALGNSDIADLPKEALHLKAGWIDYPRAKTGVSRRLPLWPETVAAIRAAIDSRPGKDSECVFVSANGNDYRDAARTGWRVTGEFRQVLSRAKIEPRKRGFYGLRRTFQTQAEACYDFVAIKAIMGHAEKRSDMSGTYRQEVSDDRLIRASNTVRAWLFGVQS